MNKADIAQYLVNLHTLLNAQEATGSGEKSRALLDEYNRQWTELKRLIKEEKENGS